MTKLKEALQRTNEATTAKVTAFIKPATKRALEGFVISINDFITARGSISKADFNKELADATEDL